MTMIKDFFKLHPWATFWVAGLLTLLLIWIVLAITLQLVNREKTSVAPARSGGHLWFVKPLIWLKNLIVWLWNSPRALPQLLVEADTNSYSLSRLQFLLWTAASIYAYTYLWLAYVFVQGNTKLPDYSDTFPWEVLLSAGTTVISQASKGIVGTKGGGPIRPHLSDLISAGGSVAPGRVQFFSWTLVSIGAYLSTVLTTDPRLIHILPEIPKGLLSISGISAGAYLGARAVSAPGPTLSLAKFADKTDPAAAAILAAAPDPAMYSGALGILVMVGSFLSPSAKLMLFLVDDSAPDEASARVPVAGFNYMTKFLNDPHDMQPNNATFYQRMVVAVLNYGTLPSPQQHYELRVQNPDGKYAEVEVNPAV